VAIAEAELVQQTAASENAKAAVAVRSAVVVFAQSVGGLQLEHTE
jgi:hypothetical protein